VVPPGDPAALAGAVLELLALEPEARAALGAEARERVRRNYDLAAVAERWVSLWAEVAARRGGARAPAPRRRVAVVISSLGRGGAERVAAALSGAWAAAGDEVTLVTLAPPSADAFAPSPLIRRQGLDLQRPSRGRVHGLVQASRRALRLRRALVALRPDLVVSFGDRTNVLVLAATVGTGLRVAVSERTDPRVHRIGAAWAGLRRLLYPRAASVVVQTESVARWARGFCRRVHVIPNAVEPGACWATPGAEEGPRRLLAIGRLERVKGFDLLVDAFARVAARHPDWSLVVLGDGPERSALEAQARRAGLAHRFELPGWTADVRGALAGAHAFALSSRYEGFPNALLEAMACGVPPVAFACPSGPGEIVTSGHDGILVPPGDVEGLASSLDAVMGDARLRERLGRNAREVAARFTPERVLDLWRDALGGVR